MSSVFRRERKRIEKALISCAMALTSFAACAIDLAQDLSCPIEKLNVNKTQLSRA